MANVIYLMIIFVFALGASITYINDTGLYVMKVPESGVQSDIGQAQQMNEAMLQTTDTPNGLGTWEQLKIVGHSIFGGAVAILTIGPLLMSLGIPIGMVGLLISPLGFALAAWLIEMWLGRPME